MSGATALTAVAALAALVALAGAGSLIAPGRQIADAFFTHDLWAAPIILACLLGLWLVRAPLRFRLDVPAPAAAAALTVAAALAAALGWTVVMGGYPFSMDEFMASFDAAIFREGRLFATIGAEWRPVRLALLPQFSILAPDGASWASSYLPVNAMALAVLGPLSGAAWTVLAGLSLYDIARRLWPARADAAVVAVALMVTSSQTLLAAMTPYAMPAHLALNLLWLCLVLRDTRWTHLAAAVVAFAACGLHQVVFHPIFAAPFVLRMLFQRKWGAAAFHILAYAAIGLFWISYWRLFLPTGAGAAAGGGASGLQVWLTRLEVVARNFTPAALGLMAKNLFRFATWQNPAALGLFLVALWPALRQRGLLRYALLGLGLMLGIITAVMPYQGHGWGYRYLHGYLGVVALLAALAWVRMTERASPDRRAALGTGLAIVCLASVVILLPLRAVQAHRMTAPYREAIAAIRRTPVEVVAVDTSGLLFGNDLVRNDPLLRNQPKVVDLVMLREPQIRSLCAGRTVAVFDQASGAAIPYARYAKSSLDRLAANRAVMREIGCDRVRVVVR